MYCAVQAFQEQATIVDVANGFHSQYSRTQSVYLPSILGITTVVLVVISIEFVKSHVAFSLIQLALADEYDIARSRHPRGIYLYILKGDIGIYMILGIYFDCVGIGFFRTRNTVSRSPKNKRIQPI